MGELILLLRQIQTQLRVGLGLLLLIAGVLALVSWLERTRRTSAFGPLSRFARRLLDPALAPLDRIVARTGGRRTSTPWWGVFAVLVAGAVFIGIVDFLRELLTFAYYASSQGPRSVLRLLVSWGFGLLQVAIMVRVVVSWIGGSYTWVGRTAFTLTEWFLAPLRRALPPIGMMDLSPIVAYFALALLRRVMVGLI
jgi:YggT family protein